MSKFLVNTVDGKLVRLSKEEVIDDAIGFLQNYDYSETDTRQASRHYVGLLNTVNLMCSASDLCNSEVLMTELLDRLVGAAFLLIELDKLEIEKRKARKLKRAQRESANP